MPPSTATAIRRDLSWLLAFAGALAYPWALREAHRTLLAEGFTARAFGMLACAFLVPFGGILAAHLGARLADRSARDRIATRMVHLVVAAPPAFTLMGVLLSLMKISGHDGAVWSVLWCGLAAYCALAIHTSAPQTAVPVPLSAPLRRLRAAHGVSALALLLVFLLPHLFNHASGAWGTQTHRAIMETLRHVYRQGWLEPLLIAAFFFQIISGVLLFKRKSSTRSKGLLDTLQTTSGIYLAVFITAHVNSVFTLARYFGIETDYAWASAAPAGLLAALWSIRLLPHYALAVFFLIAHLGCGLRGILRAHGVNARRADGAAWLAVAAGVLLSCAICAAMLGARVNGQA